ncbi:HAD family hydrolase [Rhodospirillum sp. A1_3_36]|uniref:HAD family hydrolase n=1 Tax=Rhodospirillum sp. A1_3_36 TaxID=3391666 RepID=UPI0039A664EA
MGGIRCILFDMDGTLVDSEPLMARAYTDLLDTGDLTADQIRETYRGWKLADTFADLERVLGITLPENFLETYRARTDQLFRTELRTFDGVEAALSDLDMPFCVASNAPGRKIRLAMEATGLNRLFGDRLYSAYDVGVWKPDPGLFLATAEAMGVPPEACLVVEDSPPGLEAARAAGMNAIHFQPEEGEDMGYPRLRHYRDFSGLVRENQFPLFRSKAL